MNTIIMDKIAICITTRNRREAFNKCYRSVMEFKPSDAGVFVVDDASDEPVANCDHYFTDRAGIPAAKNKCLELAMNTRTEHIFLLDDDVMVKSKDTFTQYINSPHNHLCYTFLNHSRIVGGHKYHPLGNGCAMYAHRSVVDAVGGFDTSFGMGKYEHTQWSHRIYAAGIVPAPFIDLVGSSELYHSMDEYNEVERTLTRDEQEYLLNKNRQHFYNTRNLTTFIPYK